MTTLVKYSGAHSTEYRFWKLGMILENKVLHKLKLSKNNFNKKYAPRLVFRPASIRPRNDLKSTL